MQPTDKHTCTDHQDPQTASAQPSGFNPAGYSGPSFYGAQPSQQYYTTSPVYNTGNQFWTGALIGVGAALLLSNDTVQKTLMKGATAVFNAAQAGAEEIKEKFEDIRAEMDQSDKEKPKTKAK